MSEALKDMPVHTREDFVGFVRLLNEQYDTGKWENIDLRSYLSALAAWTEDMDGYFENHEHVKTPEPSWSLFALILEAATMYE